MSIKAHDILVDTPNPALLDTTVQQLGPAVAVGGPDSYIRHEGYYVVRVFGPSGFIKFALRQQGYAKVIRELDQIP